MCRTGRYVAIGHEFQGGMGCLQILIEVGFLKRQAEAEPLGEDLVMTVAERTIGDFAAHDLAERGMGILTGERVTQGGEKDQAAEVSWNSRERFPPQFGSRSTGRFRLCIEFRQTAP